MINKLKSSYFISTILLIISMHVIADCATNIVVTVLHSVQFSDYKSARGLDLIEYHAGDSFQLIKSSVDPITDQDVYTEGRYNFLVSFTYGWDKDQSCTIYFPVKAIEQVVIEIGSGSSNGGCGE